MSKTENEQYELVRFAIERIIAHIGELFTRIQKLEELADNPKPQDLIDGTEARTATTPDP